MPAPVANAAVAVVVLNWRQYEETRGCLESLRQLTHPTRIYLVDNAPAAGARRELLDAFPDVACLSLDTNQGYAEAMNRGMERALADGATHILLLNNDVRVTPPLVNQLLALYGIQKDAGIVGPSVRFPPPDSRVQSAGIEVNRYTGRVRLRFHGVDPEEVYPYPHKVDAVPGAAFMVTAEVLREVGMFDPGYFFYFEDIDLCLRARGRGYHSYVAPRAVVYHKGGATIGDAPEQVYYGIRNQLWLLAQHGLEVSRPLELARMSYVVGLHLAQLARGRTVRLWKGLSYLGQGVLDFRAGRFGEFSGGGRRQPGVFGSPGRGPDNKI